MFYSGLFVHLLIVVDGSGYRCSLRQTNRAKSNAKLVIGFNNPEKLRNMRYEVSIVKYALKNIRWS